MRATERPIARLFAKICLYRIILNISNDFGVVSRIPNISIEIFLLPESSRPIEHFVGLACGERLYRMHDLREAVSQRRAE